jgi:hypothetical protein
MLWAKMQNANIRTRSWERNKTMQTMKYIYWQEEDMWLGYLEEYPDYWTQGETIQELEENLRDIYRVCYG